ncbi:MAG: hypothetical protein TREMPRED_000334 [Tremellales sp. Tagirdzhanova-0007]|nr:MAG: hypothetical protein TREMPRED_000334 [Tremellales sp. Tagirdzhanova-0007]
MLDDEDKTTGTSALVAGIDEAKPLLVITVLALGVDILEIISETTRLDMENVELIEGCIEVDEETTPLDTRDDAAKILPSGGERRNAGGECKKGLAEHAETYNDLHFRASEEFMRCFEEMMVSGQLKKMFRFCLPTIDFRQASSISLALKDSEIAPLIHVIIVDSIYAGDVPLQRVKFNSKMEYEYLDNFKVLQKAFNTHRIDKPIPVDRLVKCKMQDNLEFLQWLKKYWDTNSRGEGYDAVGRAGGIVPTAPPPSRAPAAGSRANARTPISAAGSRTVSTASSVQMNGLRAQVAEIQASCDGLEKERDFYFDKLRSIELIVQQRTAIEGMEVGERDTLAKLQEILYSTVEGFEVPDNGQAVADEEEGDQELAPEEEETF